MTLLLAHVKTRTPWQTFTLLNISRRAASGDSRLSKFGRTIEDEYANIRESYETPVNPIVLAHGLAGFDEIRPAGLLLPGVHYWRGITQALAAKGVEVITASVPAFGSIEERAARLSSHIAEKAKGKSVNIVAGLDSRYMVSRLHPENVKVLSLTTIATPHHGSSYADYVFDQIGAARLPRVYKALEFIGVDTGAFSQLTTKYMDTDFNPRTPDVKGIQYYSYGASVRPPLWSAFRQSHRIIEAVEGANDGLVSVASSKWGTYKGTLVDVNHLDLINWTNRLRWVIWQMMGNQRKFNAIAFYLDIADMLAKEGL